MNDMSDITADSVLLSAVSLTATAALMDASEDHDAIAKLQDGLSGKMLDANDVLTYIQTLNPQDVNEVSVGLIDKRLKHLGIKTVGDVGGLESLGNGTHPSEYLASRIAGLESFIADAYRYTKAMVGALSADATDAYTLIKESDDSLKRRVSDLEQRFKSGVVMGSEPVSVPYRYVRRLIMAGKLKPSTLPDELIRMAMTCKGIMSNYNHYSTDYANELMSFINRVAGLEEADAIIALSGLPKVLSRHAFKDAQYIDRNQSSNEIIVRHTVTWLGDHRYQSKELKPQPIIESLEATKVYVDRYVDVTDVTIVSTSKDSPDNVPVDPLTVNDAKRILSSVTKALKFNETLFKDGVDAQLSYKDYQDIIQAIDDADWSDTFKRTVHGLADRLFIRLNRTGTKLRYDTVRALTLTLNAAIGLVELNITN